MTNLKRLAALALALVICASAAPPFSVRAAPSGAPVLIGDYAPFALFDVSEDVLADLPILATTDKAPSRGRAFTPPAVPGGSRHGYDWISDPANTGANAAKLARLYEALAEAAALLYDDTREFTPNGNYYYVGICDIKSLSLPLNDGSRRLLGLVGSVFHLDNPQYYFLLNGWGTGENAATQSIDLIALMAYPEYATYAARQRDKGIIAAKYAEYEAAAAGKTDYEAAKAVHDKIINERDYAYVNGIPDNSAYAHNLMGVMDTATNGPVCESYSKAFQYVLTRLGISAITVVGTGESGPTSGNHAWNLIELNGLYYYCDVTWDDRGGANPPSYDYFMVGGGNATFTREHLAATPNPPTANGVYMFGPPSNISAADYTGDVRPTGDVTNDGRVNLNDARRLLQAVMLDGLTLDEAADAFIGGGGITLAQARYLLQHVLRPQKYPMAS